MEQPDAPDTGNNSILYWLLYCVFCIGADITGILHVGLGFILWRHNNPLFPEIEELIPKIIVGAILATVAFCVSEFWKFIKSKLFK